MENLNQTKDSIESSPAVTSSALSVKVNSQRARLYEELHNRPSPRVTSPSLVSHMSVKVTEAMRDQELDYLEDLCRRFSVSPPASDATCFYQQFGGFELRWERHLEFSTYMIIRPVSNELIAQPFEHTALSVVPRDWIEQLPGEIIVATNVAVMDASLEIDADSLSQQFEGQRVCGSHVKDDRAIIYTSFRIHSDGFGRILLLTGKLGLHQAGRLLQYVLEIETYRLLALMGLPLARSITPKVGELENLLAALNQKIAGQEVDDADMLSALSNMAAQTEKHRTDTNYRFAAANAYFEITCSRIEALEEQEIRGIQTWNEFISRRLGPGIKTCNAVQSRLEGLSRRVAQTSGLLTTRVELGIAKQNQALLWSMDKRAALQLRLQEAVEGLSVAAIAYYLLGLLGYVFAAIKSVGISLNYDVALGVSAPIVVFITWFTVRRAARALKKKEKKR